MRKKSPLSWNTLFKIAAVAMILFLCIHYWSGFENILFVFFGGLTAIFCGLVIAYIANIPMRFYERVLPGPQGDGTRNRAIACALTMISVILVLLFLFVIVLPQFVKCVIVLVQDAQVIATALVESDIIRERIPEDILVQIESIDWESVISEGTAWLQAGVISMLPEIASAIASIGAVFMGVLFAMWFLNDKIRLGGQIHRLIRIYLGEDNDEHFTKFIGLTDDIFKKYFTAQALEAVIFGTLVFLGMTIFRLPEAPMVGAFIGIMSLIPMVGVIIGAVLSAFIILSYSWQQALIFLVVFFIIQQIEANFIYMRNVGKSVGLYGLWPLIGVTLGAAFFGFPGAFIGVPVTALIFHLVDTDLEKREQLPEGSPTPLDMLEERLRD